MEPYHAGLGTEAEVIYKKRRVAALDLGSNSFLLLAMERSEEGKLTVLADESATPRIGEKIRESRWISPAAVERAVGVVHTLVDRAHQVGAEEFFVTATSAVREASNQEEVLERFSKAAGVPVELLSASEEARLAYISVTMEQPHNERSLVVDIGGGSTEVSWGIGNRFDGGRSFDLGTVKVLEQYLQNQCPSAAELDAARNEIDAQLSRLTPLGKLDHYYGTAGAFTHLASVDLALEHYSPDRVAGHSITHPRVCEWIDRLAAMPFPERLALKGVDSRRADVLLSGTLIIERLFKKFGNDSFQVFDRGVRFGKVFDVLRGFVPPVHFA